MKSATLRLCFLPLLVLLGCTAAVAQSAPAVAPVAPAAAPKAETIVLSPFEVTSETVLATPSWCCLSRFVA